MSALPAGIIHFRGGFAFKLTAAEGRQYGRPYQSSKFPTVEVAQAARIVLLAPRHVTHKTAKVPPAKPTFSDAVKAYMRDGHDTAYHQPLATIMVEFFGTMPLQDMTVKSIREYKRWRVDQYRRGKPEAGRTVKPATINRDIHSRLAGLLTWASDPELGNLLPLGWVNPVKSKALKNEREPDSASFKRQALREPTREALMLALPAGEVRIAAQLAYLLAVRLGTLLRMRWDDIDWEHEPPSLTYWSAKGKGKLKQFTKPLGAEALALLESLGRKPTGRVFQHLTIAILRVAWKRACLSVGLPRLRFHDLRAHRATILSKRGANPKTIQKALGHSTPTMTMHYLNSTWDDEVEAANL